MFRGRDGAGSFRVQSKGGAPEHADISVREQRPSCPGIGSPPLGGRRIAADPRFRPQTTSKLTIIVSSCSGLWQWNTYVPR